MQKSNKIKNIEEHKKINIRNSSNKSREERSSSTKKIKEKKSKNSNMTNQSKKSIQSPSKSKRKQVESEFKDQNLKHLPKNVNEYRHIIDTKQSRDSDVEWILELRAYNKKRTYESLKDSLGIEPDLYREGLREYRRKTERDMKERKNNKLMFKGNCRDFEHLMIKKIGESSNPFQLGFDSTLRMSQIEKTEYLNPPWKTLALSPKKNLFSIYLPPMSKNSLRNLENLKDLVSRPLEQIEDKSPVDGNQIRRRKFFPSHIHTSISGGEHLSSPLYSLKYKTKNLGNIKHLLQQQINSVTHWESDLRNYEDKKSI